jgi:hypothetical protein
MPLHHLDRHRTPAAACVIAVLLAVAVAAPAWSSVASAAPATAATPAPATRPLPGPQAAADVHAAPRAVRRPAPATRDQDLRSPDARDASTRSAALVQDLRHLRAGGTAVRPPLPGPPSWPTDPQPITPGPAANVSHDTNGLNWATIGLGIAGSLIAVSGIVALTGRRSRRLQRARTAP